MSNCQRPCRSGSVSAAVEVIEKVSPGDFFGAERFAAPWGQVVSRRMIAKGVCGSTASVAPALG